MGKTFVEDERPCDSCVNVTRYGCASWNCEYINRDEAIKAWREKYETADRKTEPNNSKVSENPTDSTRSKMEQVEITADDFNEDDEFCEDCRWFNPKGSLGCDLDDDECHYSPKDEPQTDCAWK